jgi:hypothetical protein
LGQGGWILPRLLCNNFLVVGNLVARRSVLRELGGFDSSWPPVEDYHLWVRVASAHRIEYRDVEVAKIRLHGGNSSNDMDRSYWKSEGVREDYLLAPGCLADVTRRARAGQPAFRTDLSRVCLDLSRQRWWQGNIEVSRRAFVQAVRLCPLTAVREMGELWRAWLPHHRMTAAGLK